MFYTTQLGEVAQFEKKNLIVADSGRVQVFKNQPSDEYPTIIHSSLLKEVSEHYYTGVLKLKR